MNTSPARTPFMDYETRKEIKGRKYVFQSQTKKNFISNENPRSILVLTCLTEPINNKFTQCLQIDKKGMGFFVKWKSWQTLQRKSGSITSRKSSKLIDLDFYARLEEIR